VTRKQFRRKLAMLIRENNRAIKKKAEELFKSGCVDLSAYGDDFKLPKTFMSAVCYRMSEEWNLFTKEAQREARNMRHFI
jgi:hypothetical protein